MASKNNNPKGRENELVVQNLKGEVLLYDLTNNKAYCLNETSAAIWNLCDGNSSVSDITKQLSKKLKQPVTDDLVYLALDQFKQDNLLSDNEKVEIKFDGLSRREVIRKVGFASMVALPVIASLIAPTAAMAQSAGSRTLGQTCTTSAECASSAPNCVQTGASQSCCVNNVASFSSGDTFPALAGDCAATGTNACCSKVATFDASLGGGIDRCKCS